MVDVDADGARDPMAPERTRVDNVGTAVIDLVRRRDTDAVLFDCDGTLVDSEPIGHRIWGALADDLGVVAAPGADAEGLSFEQRLETLRTTNPALPPTEVVYAEYWRRLRAAFDESLRPIEPTYHLALELIRADVPIAIVSNSAQERLRYTVFCALPLLTDVPLVGWTPRDRPKPHPDLYRRAASVVSTRADRCLAIEDSTVGALAASRAGMRALILDAPAH
ncbi:HAD family hydrolase [Microbacterium arborescens]|uniref:HAD family hydrolase n=1 Tax=Microbacterium arborescens TaxID=33883 RepID=UPI002789FD83|nr:HAD family phosphatase [Microbacterium arborescens]MDQ1217697.1 HAD superfamily hydrolase (TIGR01509 family) [Microbacterium arborescens]